jgi:hypothetical protein
MKLIQVYGVWRLSVATVCASSAKCRKSLTCPYLMGLELIRRCFDQFDFACFQRYITDQSVSNYHFQPISAIKAAKNVSRKRHQYIVQLTDVNPPNSEQIA